VGSLDELTGLVAELRSAEDSALVEAIRDSAGDAFHKSKDKDTLYYSAQIAKVIRDRFPSVFKEVPTGASRTAVDRWALSRPRYLRRDSNRIVWQSSITIESSAWRAEVDWLALGRAFQDLMKKYEETKAGGAWAQPYGSYWQSQLFSRPDPLSGAEVVKPEKLFAKGKAVFDVTWDLEILDGDLLRDARLLDVELRSNEWQTVA
jgi:hypothetical protein